VPKDTLLSLFSALPLRTKVAVCPCLRLDGLMEKTTGQTAWVAGALNGGVPGTGVALGLAVGEGGTQAKSSGARLKK
jgi:hypothetical protein